MGSLRDLGELQRVAEQDERARRGAHRERVGERDLSGLVDEEVVERLVELLAGEQPGGAGDQPDLRVGEAVLRGLDERPLVMALRRCRSTFFSPRNATPASRAAFSTSRSRLWIALWLVDATPTRLPRGEQVDDQPRARSRLARAGRALHERDAGPRRARRAPSSRRASTPGRARRRAASRGAAPLRAPGSGRRRRRASAQAEAAPRCCAVVS